MNIFSCVFDKIETIPNQNYDYAIFGKSIDERGEASVAYLKNNSKESFLLEYDPVELKFIVNGNYEITETEISNWFNKLNMKHVLLDVTTLGFVEILYSLENLENTNLEAIYFEPEEYYREQLGVNNQDFEYILSDEKLGFHPIANRLIEFSYENYMRIVLSLGFERDRIENFFEQNEFNTKHCELIVGLPAYKTGWELNTFGYNIDTLVERVGFLDKSIHYAAANSPINIYHKLEKIFRSLDSSERMLIFPAGTKPHLLGVALFASKNESIGLMFDFPIQSKNRTKKISKIHLFKIDHSLNCE